MSMQVLWRWLKPLQCAHVLSGCKVHFIPFWLLFSCRHPTFESYALHLCLCWSVHYSFPLSPSLSLFFPVQLSTMASIDHVSFLCMHAAILETCPCMRVHLSWYWSAESVCVINVVIECVCEIPNVTSVPMVCRLAVTWHISPFWLNVVVLTMAAHIWHRCRRNLLCRKPTVVARS